MVNVIGNITHHLETVKDLDPLIEQAGNTRAVLIGEATHGTSEFYKWRAEITKRLIEEKGFSFVSIEGDWPDSYQVNRYVKNVSGAGESAYDVLYAFDRWPTWMWANREVVDFIEWLAAYNKERPEKDKAGFYGLDVYSLWESLRETVVYLDKTDPEAAKIAREAYRCFEPYRQDITGYAWTAGLVPEACEDEVVELLAAMEHIPPRKGGMESEDRFSAEQNALVAVNAEHYYRIMLGGGADSWNLRDEHMTDTFFRLLDFYSKETEAKGIVWAHNTHVGDARFTDMATAGELNIGQLVRDRLGWESSHLIGFGSYQGSVIAADAWDAPMKKMPLPPAMAGSWENLLHGFNQRDRLILFRENEKAARMFSDLRGNRAVGVVYDPYNEFGNYVPTILSERYDSFLYIDRTSALHPLHLEAKEEGPPETFPRAV